MNLKQAFVYLSCFLCLATFCIGQTAVVMPAPKIQFLDANGRPLAGGCVNTYAAGTTTNQATYKDSTSSAVNTNPVILDSAGRASIFTTRGVLYKVVVTSAGGANCSTGTLQYTQDNIPSGSSLVIGGVNGQVQYNGSGTLAGSPNFTWNNATATLSTGALNTTSGGILSGSFGGNPIWTGAHNFNGAITVGNINGVVIVDGVKYPLTGTGLSNAVTDCIGSSSCPGVDARSLTVGVTLPSTLTISKPMFFWLGPAAVALQGGPGLLVTAAATGATITGGGATLSCSVASSNCVVWLASNGTMQDLTITTPTNTTNGLDLDASLALQDIKFNKFKNITITAPSTNTADGIHAVAVDATHKISFNHFENFNIIDFLNAQHFTTTGTVGPTDNVTIGGQFRQTVLRGSGILLDAVSQDNVWIGGDISVYTNAINLGAFATVTDNKFFGVVPESNTNAIIVGAGAADNQFYGVPLGGQGFTDSGTRTVIQTGNNAIGPSGAVAQKQGAPFMNLALTSSGGFPVTLTSSAGAPLTANVILSMATGTATVDLASVASGACTADSADVTLTGAVVGDPARVVSATALPAGVWLIGRVTAADKGRFQLCNLSGGAVDRASDTYTISVVK